MYIVVGASGFLGSYFIKNILEYTTEDVIAVARNITDQNSNGRVKWISSDLSDFTSIDDLTAQLNNYEKIKVIYLVAYHNPDLVEKNPALAWHVNVTCLSYFLNKLSNTDCFYYPSTDSVYGNSVNSYHFVEDDKRNPVNTYGRQKVVAEEVVLGKGYNVVRFPFLIAPSLSLNKKHFYDRIREDLLNGKPVEMFADSYRSSLNFDTAAKLVVNLMKTQSKEIPQILNVCGDSDLSKYDIGLLIAETLNVDENLVVPISVNGKESIFNAPRAQSTLMDNSLLKNILGINKIAFEI